MTSTNLKVLQVIDTSGPGGAETVFAQLATGLEEFGISTAAIIGEDGWLSHRLRSCGSNVQILPAKGSVNLIYLRQLVRAIESQRPDVVLAHLAGPAVYCSLAGLLTGTPVASVIHGHSDFSRAERLLKTKAAIIRHGSRKVVFVSEHLRDALSSRLGLRGVDTPVIPNGVDVAQIMAARPASLRAELGLDAETFLVGAVGNIRPPKAYDVLLRAAKIAVEAEPRVRLVIAGDFSTPLFEQLKQLHSNLGLEGHLHFLGLRTDVPNVLRALDAFVLSSSSEGFSIACCEAMAAGVPVVATRSGGPEQILDAGACGILAPVADPAALADGIIRLARSPSERLRLSHLARERVATNYGLDTMLARYSNLLLSCSSEHAPHPR